MKEGLPGGTLERVNRRSELEEAHAHVARWIGSKSTSSRCVSGQRCRRVGRTHCGATGTSGASTVRQIEDHGEQVFVAVRETGQGIASEAAVSADNYVVVIFREGRIAHYREFYDEQQRAPR